MKQKTRKFIFVYGVLHEDRDKNRPETEWNGRSACVRVPEMYV